MNKLIWMLITLVTISSQAWSQSQSSAAGRKVRNRAPAQQAQQVQQAEPTEQVEDTAEPSATETDASANEETTEPTPPPPPAEETKPLKQASKKAKRKDDRKWRFTAGLGYQLVANEGEFEDAQFSDSTESFPGEAELEYKSAFVIVLEGRFSPRNSWGFIGGLNYEGERQLKSGKARGGGSEITFTGGSDASKVQFSTLYGSAVFRWEEFYLPFGLNYSIFKFTPAKGSTGSVSASGGVGAQLGVGWMFNRHFALELYSWVTSSKLKISSGGTTLDFNDGYFSSLVLVGKYAF